MFADHISEDIPYFCGFPLDHLLGRLDSRCKTFGLKLAEDKWLKEFQCHFLWQTTLVQP